MYIFKGLKIRLTAALLMIMLSLSGCGKEESGADSSVDDAGGLGNSSIDDKTTGSITTTESIMTTENITTIEYTTREEPTTELSEDGYLLSNDSSDFVIVSEVIPEVELEIRYYSDYNFVGERIDGYEEPVALLTKEAAESLKEVSEELYEKGYRLKIYDAYRPQMAVSDFIRWAEDIDDTKMKEDFYPELDKSELFEQGYISGHSGHSRGSTVDLTLVDIKTGQDVDMGGTFDYFGERSHADYTDITEEQYSNRMILREAMTSHGFRPFDGEWWHFTLNYEPFPDTYYTFTVSTDSLYR